MDQNTSQPITTYAEPLPAWEAWYHDYRYGAFYLFPPEPLRGQVNALRARYDPTSQAICDAHISLTVPVPRPLTVADAAEVAAALRAEPAFDLAWGPPWRLPASAVVVLRIEPAPALERIVAALEGCACLAGAAPRRFPFLPHMTIAEFATPERSDAILAELAPQALAGTFRCDRVAYAVPDAAFHFTERMTWPLGSGAVPAPGAA